MCKERLEKRLARLEDELNQLEKFRKEQNLPEFAKFRYGALQADINETKALLA